MNFFAKYILCSAFVFVACENAVPQQNQLQKKAAPVSSSSEIIAESSCSSSEEISSSSELEISSSSILSVSKKGKKGAYQRNSKNADTDTTPEPAPEENLHLCDNVPEYAFCDERDGNIYNKVKIGSQVWMAENLKYAAEGSWCYNDRHDLCNLFGRLYTWTAALALSDQYLTSSAGSLISSKHQGACPEGWRIPTSGDMKILSSFIAEKNAERGTEGVGTSLKAMNGWKKSKDGKMGTNRYGFKGVPAGSRHADGSFGEYGEGGSFWVAEETADVSRAPYWDLYYANDQFWGEYSNLKKVAYSVRCIRY